MLFRSLDHLLKGRLTVNIINSDLPGMKEDPELRYRRCSEVIEILKQSWTRDAISFNGEVYKNLNLPADPVKPYQQNGGPLLYFGGISPGSREICARHCDVFLMWPEPEMNLYCTMQELSNQAHSYGRTIDFGLRIHVIVRDTEEEARAYAKQIMSRFDIGGLNLKDRAQDSKSAGVLRQDQVRPTGRILDVGGADVLLDPREARRSHRQFPQSETQQELGVARIAAHFAAQPDRDARRLRPRYGVDRKSTRLNSSHT